MQMHCTEQTATQVPCVIDQGALADMIDTVAVDGLQAAIPNYLQ